MLWTLDKQSRFIMKWYWDDVRRDLSMLLHAQTLVFARYIQWPEHQRQCGSGEGGRWRGGSSWRQTGGKCRKCHAANKTLHCGHCPRPLWPCPLCPLSTVAMSGTKQAHHMHHTQTHDLENVWKCHIRKIFQHWSSISKRSKKKPLVKIRGLAHSLEGYVFFRENYILRQYAWHQC